MNTTELFDFNFVDRTDERVKMEKFLSNSNNDVLWISGKRGLGKTKFFQYVFQGYNNFTLCYTDIGINENSADVISEFIIELQKHSNLSFMEYIKNNYKQFYNKTYQKTKGITSEMFPQLSKIVSIILDFGYYVTTYSDENKNTIDIISDYIQTIIESKKICICIDNFSRCDKKTAQIFLQILKKFLYEENFKSCIITTTDDLDDDFKKEILSNLPFTPIEIETFSKFEYFYQIMNPIFELDEFTYEDFEYLYQKCHGSPKKLSTTISKLLEKSGITLNRKKARIDKKILMSILQKNRIKFEDGDFSSEKKWVIFSYLCLPQQISVTIVRNLALYISKRCFLYAAYDERLFNKELLTLIENKILKYDLNNIISACHDLDYIELMDIFKESQLKGLFSQYTYEFLLQNPEFPFCENLLCRHAREANIIGWEARNFRYGKKLFHNGQIYDAQTIFTYLENSLHKLHPMELLLIALTAYESGNYQLAIERFHLISPSLLKFPKAKFYYYFYLGKSLNNVGQTGDAADILEKALNEVEEDSVMYAHTLNILHMYYIEIPEKYEQAKNIFNFIQNSYENVYPTVWANTMRGCPNFLNDTVSLELLDRADSKLQDELEKAYIKNTKGFILVKLDKIREAEEHFVQSGQIIKRLKIHEFSYAANNLAVCYMIQGQYKNAREILLEALLWSRTNYGNIVLYTHLMICSFYLLLEDETNYYFNLLKDYTESHKIIDSVMKRKIYMNLAIVCQKRGNHIFERAYFESAKYYIKNTSSEWRYRMLTNNIDSQLERPSAQYLRNLDFEPWFLIYAHD